MHSLTVKTKSSTYIIPFQEILYIESNMRKLRIHWQQDIIECYGKLSEICESLSSKFIRCHQSFCVNPEWIRVMERFQIELTNGDTIPISQSRSEETKRRFSEFLQSRAI